jgi:hypothetical protein
MIEAENANDNVEAVDNENSIVAEGATTNENQEDQEEG